MKKVFLFISTFIIFSTLIACSKSSISDHQVSLVLHSLNEELWDNFSLSSSEIFVKKILRDDGSYAFMTYDNAFQKRIESDFAVHVYPPETTQIVCSPNNLGVMSYDWKEHGLSHWGKVTYWDHPIKEGVEDLPSTICTPPELWGEKWYTRTPEQYAAYALCSEKDGKRVVICIQQMTDNPALAEEIFSTFKWTE